MAAKAKVEKYKVQFNVTERNFANVVRYKLHRWLFQNFVISKTEGSGEFSLNNSKKINGELKTRVEN